MILMYIVHVNEIISMTNSRIDWWLLSANYQLDHIESQVVQAIPAVMFERI